MPAEVRRSARWTGRRRPRGPGRRAARAGAGTTSEPTTITGIGRNASTQQLPRREREDGADQDDVERRLQDRRRADVEEPLELVDVVVEGGQRRARPAGSRASPCRGAGRGRRPRPAGRARRPGRGRARARRRRTRDADSMIQTTTLIDGEPAQLGVAGLDAEHARRRTSASPRTTTSTAAPMSSSGTTSATLLTVDADDGRDEAAAVARRSAATAPARAAWLERRLCRSTLWRSQAESGEPLVVLELDVFLGTVLGPQRLQ